MTQSLDELLCKYSATLRQAQGDNLLNRIIAVEVCDATKAQ